ncbi:phage tail tape measure protein [Paraclostridium sordellii]|uniref:phage tail tape measure protein n=1 Tax=Paraclostridium sordellii TaxID=1505 RepID=UPI0022E7EEBF|nr:phage tail tape measure protein [Paeniclostridium sordellii]
MEDINVKVDLDLDDSKAKEKLENFKESVTKQEVKVKLDFSDINSENTKINKAFKDAFKLSSANDLEKIEKKLKEINNLMSKQKDIRKNLDSSSSTKGLDKSIKEYLSVVKKIESLNAELHKAQSTNNESVVSALNNEIQLYQRKQLQITSSIRANNQLSDSVRQIVAQEENLARARTQTRNAKTDTTNFARQESELSRLNAEYDRYSNKLNEIQNKLNSMKQSKGFLDEGLVQRTNTLLEQTRHSLDANGIESDFKEINNVIRGLEGNMKQLNLGNTISKQEANFNVSLENMRQRLEKFTNSIKHIKGSDQVIENLSHSFNSINTSNIERANADLKQFASRLNRTEHEFRQLKHASSGGFFSKFGKDFKANLLPFTAGQLLADGIRKAFYGVKDVVMDLDSAFTDLRKVADPKDVMNVQQLDSISDKATSIAKNVGQSSGDVIRSIADTIQMTGKSMGESTIIAEQTMKLANVADMTQKQATEGVATMVSAFKLDAFKDIDIRVGDTTKKVNEMENAFDKLNYVGNNFAISSSGLVEALQSGGSVLATYGVSLTDTLSMITAANMTIQDPKRVGNGLKSIAVNLQGIKASADTGELSLNKTAKTLQEVANIDIFEDEKSGKIKNTSKIIDELGNKWKSFTDEQKAGISEAIAGKNQAAVFQSLMSNFETFKKAQSEMNMGKHFKSMQQENEKYVQSLAGQLNRLKETWVGIFNDVFDKNLLAGALGGINAISEAFAKLVSHLKETGMLQPILAGVFGFLAFRQVSGLVNIVKEIKGVMGAVKTLGTVSTVAKETSTVVSETASVVDAGLNVISNASEKTGEKVIKATGKFDAAKAKLSAFKDLILPTADMLPVLGVYALAASAGVYALSKAYDYFNESADEQLARTKKEVETRRESVKSYDDQIKGLKEIQEEYDNLNNKQDKSEDDLQRLKELSNQIAQIKPELKVGEDKDGNAIIALTGNVKDLIGELKSAQQEQKILLQDADYEDAKSLIRKRQNKKEFGGLEGGSQLLGTTNTLNDMQKLEEAMLLHKLNVENLEKEKSKMLKNIHRTTGKERKKALKRLKENDLELQKEQETFNKTYSGQIKEIEETNKQIGDRLFNYVENSSRYANAKDEIQKQFSDLKGSLDFSEVQSDEDLEKTTSALGQLFDCARMGKINLGDLKKSLSDANEEFQKTQDSEKYNETIAKLVEEISKATNVDPDILTRLFKGLDTSPLKQGTDALDKFLKQYGKSAKDLQKDDSFAKALAEQRLHIQAGLESIKDAFNNGNIEYKKKVLVDLSTDENLPKQLRDLIRTLLDKDENPNDILEVAQSIMVNLENGTLNVDEINKVIQERFHDKSLEITPDILISDKAKVEGVKTVIKQLEERFDEVPTTVKTIIKTESITAFNEAKELTEMYNKIPQEVRTSIVNNGLESSQTVKLVDDMLANLPPEVVTELVNNYPDVIKKSTDYESLLKGLPQNVVTDIVVNSDSTTIETIKQAVKDMPEQKQVIIDVLAGAANGNIEQVNNALSNLPPERRMEILAEIQNALSGMDTVESRQLSEKIAKLMADPSIALQGIGQINGTPMTPKNTKVTESGSGVVQTMLNRIKNTPDKHHRTQATETGSSHVKRLLDLIKGVPNKKHTTTVINNGGQSVLDNLLSIVNLPSTKTIKVVANLIGDGVSALKKYWGFGAGGELKDGKITRTITQKLNVENSPSPVPMTTGEGSTISSPIPTSESMEGNDVPYGGDVVPSGYTTAAPLNSNGIDIGKIIPSFNYDINMLSSMENQLKGIAKQLNIISAKSKDAFGNEKIGYLNTQIELLRKQQSIQHELAESMRKQQNEVKYQMLGYGFTFDGDRVVNDIDLLMKANRTVDDLDRRVKADTENKDKALRNEYDAAKTSLDKSKKLLSEYISLTFDKIPACSQEWWNLNDKIKSSTVEILKAKNELESMRVQIDSDKFDDNIKKIASEISLLDKQIANGYGGDVQSLINKKIALLKKEQDETHNLAESYRYQAKLQREVLSNQGFIFDNNGQLTNRELINSYIGTGLFDELNKQINEYNNLVHDKIPKLSVEWWSLYETISKTNESTIELVKNTEALPFNNSLEEISHAMDRVHDKLDLLEKKFKYVYGSDKVGYFNKRIELLEEEKKLVSDQYKEYLNVYNVLRKQVEPFGVKIDDSSLITNYDEVLNKYIGNNQYDQVKKALDDYINLTRKDIPDAWKKLLDLDNDIKDAQKNKLDVIKNMEDEITKVYAKQVEERKKLIDDETKAKIKAINEEKDAYNKSRKEVKYNEELKDQKDVINKLNEDIENAKRDTSVSGQKHLKELLDKLKDENKKLQDLVQNKTDEVVNEMFDKESDRLQEDADKKKEALDQKFSPENIQNLVNEALNTGLFTDIDGNVKSLEDTLLDFVSKTSEGMGALGGVIKSELVTNLELAKDAYQELADIYKSLDMDKFYKSPINSQTPINNSGNSTTNNKVDVNFNQPFMVIHKVTKDAVPELEILLKKSEKRLAEEIVKNM